VKVYQRIANPLERQLAKDYQRIANPLEHQPVEGSI